MPLFRRIRSAALALGGVALAACRPADPAGSGPSFRKAPDEISVMSWNLDNYRPLDRTGDGQASDPKPLPQRQAIAALIRRVAPDVLILQEMGNPAVFEEFRASLEQNSLHYPHSEHLAAPDSEQNLALFSRHPILHRTPRLQESYRIGTHDLFVQCGFLDVEIKPPVGRNLRILAAHLKSKTFHPAGQTEMRRNEARLLGAIVRRILREDPATHLIVAGTFNDFPDSAALREIRNDPDGLTDLRPVDAQQEAWTWQDTSEDAWRRVDYLLASPALARHSVPDKTLLLRVPDPGASSHRPLLAVFRLPPASPP
ncbi:MAG: endonuclease/exonuclease/phosphatase family protein [Kiritimatiellia bacterium]|nr:endonuclease/exonuclease/phosphatase family protein [Kiritimatiellia bacterium]